MGNTISNETFEHQPNYLEEWDTLKKTLTIKKKAGQRIVFTNGCFDLLHCGHLHILHEAKKLGDILVVAVNDDASIARLKGHGRPIKPLFERANVMASLRCVDYVTRFSQDTPLELIMHLAPTVDVIAKGLDYKAHEVVGHDIVEAYGGRVAIIGWKNQNATTTFVQKSMLDKTGKVS